MRVRLPLPSALCIALLLLSEPSLPLLISIACSVLHELGHLFAMRARGVPIRRITIYPFGPIIEPAPHMTSYTDDCIIYGSGIAANLLAALLLTAAVCTSPLPSALLSLIDHAILSNLSLSLLNALPHPALDGGCVLSALLLRSLEPSLVGHLMRFLGDLSVLFMSAFVLYGLFYGLSGMSGVFFLLYLVAKMVAEGEEG